MNIAEGKIELENSRKQVRLIVSLLEKTTTKEVVCDFLKAKGLSFSGTWSDILEKRILPAFAENKVSLQELINLLSGAEETGRQHILLYQLPANVLKELSREEIEQKVRHTEFNSLLSNPKVIDKPDQLTVSDIRWDSGSLVVKAISKRTRHIPLGEKIEDNRLIKEYQIEESRAISLLKVHSDGLCEVRISSKSTASRYSEEVLDFLRALRPFISWERITSFPLNLQNAKSTLWENRKDLSGVVRFSDATLHNGRSTMRVASGDREDDLLQDELVANSVEQFSGDSVYCDTNNVFFQTVEGQKTPSKEIHVLMSGELNEFVVTASCGQRDYDYVLRKILGFNDAKS